MTGTERDGWCDSGVDGLGERDAGSCDTRKDVESLEERLAAKLFERSVWENRRAVRIGEVYDGVEDYDPVLKAHCRL